MKKSASMGSFSSGMITGKLLSLMSMCHCPEPQFSCNFEIDSQLFWSTPKFEELNSEEQKLFHGEKDTYNSIARKGGKGLHFARSGKTGETWVPLIEKAYAKLHGDFAALNGGWMCEAIEDLTG